MSDAKERIGHDNLRFSECIDECRMINRVRVKEISNRQFESWVVRNDWRGIGVNRMELKYRTFSPVVRTSLTKQWVNFVFDFGPLPISEYPCGS